MVDFGIYLEAHISSDTSAALGIIFRQGLGKTRHINVQYLWIQGKIKNRELDIGKVWGGENPADSMAKDLAVDLL